MSQNVFEEIKRVNDKGDEYWSARDLYRVLEYVDYRNFQNVIEKAKEACKNSNQVIHNHFVDANDMVKLGSNAEKPVDTVFLSRYACYLIIQNSNPSKVVVAKGQTYFAIQTKRQEDSDNMIEDTKRVALRGEVSKHNTSLAKSATSAGVKNFGKFQNFGYKGLYGGLDATDIHKKKKLSKSQKILDHMGSEELAANLFRATQADAKLRREGIHNEAEASTAHFYVGQKVRKIIQELGGTMPEQLPTPDGIAKAQTRIQKSEKKLLKDGEKKQKGKN
jgi:DNA-damage-inducible protein D